MGPRLVIQPGQGVGPIYFGATVETIERQMGAPCDLRTEDKCVYVQQALEFTLGQGVMVRAKAHLRDRPVPGTDQLYGTFNGGMRPKIMLGLHRHVVVEEYGEPLAREEIPLRGKTGLIARHVHDGVIFEFDKIENGNVVLSAMEVVPKKPGDDSVDASPGP